MLNMWIGHGLHPIYLWNCREDRMCGSRSQEVEPCYQNQRSISEKMQEHSDACGRRYMVAFERMLLGKEGKSKRRYWRISPRQCPLVHVKYELFYSGCVFKEGTLIPDSADVRYIRASPIPRQVIKHCNFHPPISRKTQHSEEKLKLLKVDL